MMTRNPTVVRVALFLAIATLAACGPPEREEPDPQGWMEDAYVEVMTQLMLLDARLSDDRTLAAPEALAADSVRREILEAQGVTAEQIIAFAEAAGGEPGLMETLWERIAQRFDSVRIANLRKTAGTESSPAEEIRAATADSTGRRGPETADTRDSSGMPDAANRRGTAQQRSGKRLPGARDTTGGPG